MAHEISTLTAGQALIWYSDTNTLESCQVEIWNACEKQSKWNNHTPKYQEYLLWVKSDQCVGLTVLPPSHAGYLEILEASNS